MKIKIESVLSVVAVLISVVALITTWFEYSASRRHDRLSVKPIVAVAFKLTGEKDSDGFFIANNGLGPAIIKKLKIFWNNELIDEPDEKAWAEVFDKMQINGNCMKKALISGSVLKPGEEHIIVGRTKSDFVTCQVEFLKYAALEEKISIEVVYESIYGEQFISRSRAWREPYKTM